MTKKAVMSLSGGMDSTTLLAFLLDSGYEVECLFFDYGSKHNPYEIEAMQKVAAHYQVPITTFDLKPVMSKFKSNLLHNGGEIPEGHFEQDNMELTVVPSRNIIFMSIASGFAWSVEAQYIALGIHFGDHAVYPDCRKEFYKAMDSALYLGTDRRVELLAPFVEMTKADIVSVGRKLDVPYGLTRTCYKNQPIACGKCGSCVERQEAFALNGMVDPVMYEDSEFWKSQTKIEELKNA